MYQLDPRATQPLSDYTFKGFGGTLLKDTSIWADKVQKLRSSLSNIGMTSEEGSTTTQQTSAGITPADLTVDRLSDITPDLGDVTSGSLTGITYSDFVGCKVTKSSAQTINDDTDTVISWDQEEFDDDNMHDNSTNTGRFTVHEDGRYLIGFLVQWDKDVNGIRRVIIGKNGTSIFWYPQNALTDATKYTYNWSNIVLELEADDWVHLKGTQTSGGNLDIIKTYSTFWIQRIK